MISCIAICLLSVAGPFAESGSAKHECPPDVAHGAVPEDQAGPVSQEALSPSADEEIVVTAPKVSGEIVTPYRPLLRLDKKSIRALGAPSLDKLLQKIQSVTQATGAGMPVLLLNGRRIARQEDIASLPPEAIEQMDVLPEPVASKFGYPATSQVINIVTAKKFTSVQIDASRAVLSDGSGKDTKAAGSGTVLRGKWRALLTVGRRGRDAVIASSSAGYGSVPGFATTLVPAESAMNVAGSFAGSIGRELNMSLSADLDQARDIRFSNAAIQSQAKPGDIIDPHPKATLRSGTTSVRAAGTIQGFHNDWIWHATANAETTRNEQVGQALAGIAGLSVRSGSNEGKISFAATGPLVVLPGGPAFVTLTAEAGLQSAAAGAQRWRYGGRLHRRTASADLSIALPLTPPDDLALSVNVSAQGLITSLERKQFNWTAGLWASPVAWAQISASYASRAAPPTLAQISAPVTILPDMPFFDRASGRDLLVDRISGGNPDLRAERRKTLDLGFDIQPFAERSLRFAATYSIAATNGSITSLGASDAMLEAAFPELYQRDATGRLVSVSSIPVNLRWSRQRVLTWSISYLGDLGAAGPERSDNSERPHEPLFALFSLAGTHRLEDTVQLVSGLPPLNLLNGATLESIGGRPKFELTALGSLGSKGLGVDLSVQWRSSSRQRSDEPASDLVLPGLLTVRLGAFVNLETLGRAAWMRALRLEIAADNVLDERQKVRDRFGKTPLSLGPERLSPIGRTVTMSLRKLL
jgi:iron complex outermembrane recepter protein